MKKLTVFFCFSLIALLLAGCDEKPKPPLQYYETANIDSNIPSEYEGTVYLNIFSESIPTPSKSKTIVELPPAVLAALIKAYGDDNTLDKQTLKELHKTLFGQPAVKASINKPVVDYSRLQFSQRVTLFIATVYMIPVNRIQELNIKMTPNNSELKITSLKNLEAKKRTIKVGTTEQKTVQETSVGLGLSPPIPIGSADISASQTQSITGKRNLDFEIPYVQPYWTEEEANLTLKAPFYAIDIAGEYKFDINMEYPHASSDEVLVVDFDIDPANFGPDPVGGQLRLTYYRVNLTDIVLDVKWDYILRKVYSKKEQNRQDVKTLDEDDDDVTFQYFIGTEKEAKIASQQDQVLCLHLPGVINSKGKFSSLYWDTKKYALNATPNAVTEFEIKMEGQVLAYNFTRWIAKGVGEPKTIDGGLFYYTESDGTNVYINATNRGTLNFQVQLSSVNTTEIKECD